MLFAVLFAIKFKLLEQGVVGVKDFSAINLKTFMDYSPINREMSKRYVDKERNNNASEVARPINQ